MINSKKLVIKIVHVSMTIKVEDFHFDKIIG